MTPPLGSSTPLHQAAGKLRHLAGSWLVPATVTLLSFSVTLGVWGYLRHNEEREYVRDLTSEIALITVELRDRLRTQGEFLRGLRSFLEMTPDVSPAQWSTYTERLEVERHNTSLVSYAFAARVKPTGIAAFTESIRRRNQLAAFSISPPPLLDDAFVVVSVAPHSVRTLRTIGVDMFADEKRRSAVENARDTDNVSMSGRIALAADQKESALQSSFKTPLPPAFLMILPVYRPGERPATVSERRQDIAGIVVAAFRMNEFMASLNYSRHGRVALRIFDDESFNTSRENGALALLYDTIGSMDNPLGQLEEREIEFGQRRWLIQFQPREALPVIRESSMLLLGGLAISLLLGLLTWTQASRRAQAERYAKAMNSELQLSEERFRLAAQGANDALWDRNFGSNQIYVSERMEELFGYPPGSMVREINALLALVHPDDLPAIRAATIRHLKERAPYDVEYRMRKADGRWGWFSSHGQAVWGKDGRALRMAGTITDISRRKEAELAILQTNRKLQAVLDAATEVAIIATDTAGFVRIFNRGAEKMLGYDAREMIDCQSVTTIHLDSEILQRATVLTAELGRPVDGFGIFTALPQTQMAEHCEWTYIRKNGSPLSVSLVVTALHDESENISGYLCIAVDITDRKVAETELLRHRDHLRELVAEQVAHLLVAKDVAERANHSKSEFLANMSHELRTPLHAVLSFAAIGEEKASAASMEKLGHYFQRIRQAGDRLLMLLNNLLDLSKLEAGKMHVELMPHDVLPFIHEASAELEPLLAQRALRLSIEPPGVSTTAICDPTRFGQVIRNLLSNAIKFSPEHGRITVRFERSSMAVGHRTNDRLSLPTLRITVSDEGIGIPADELITIFDKFVQSSKTRNGAGGTGLGLSICQEIMQTHRGTISACNNPGRGASFVLDLPISPMPFLNSTPRDA